MKRKLAVLAMTAVLGLSAVACGSEPAKEEGSKTEETGKTEEGGKTEASDVANKDKPLVWFNRQPSNSSTGELDKNALNFNKDTYYVGFDANQGAELQGQMVKEYIEKNADTIDRNGDPVGTNVDGKQGAVKDGSLEAGGKTFVVRELGSQEMKNSAGATWDAATAGNAIGTWSSSFGDQIDVVVSNNDGMGMSMFNAWSKENKVPTFGYDANSDAVAAIAEGYGGTISQHADVQAYLTLRVLRNSLDGVG